MARSARRRKVHRYDGQLIWIGNEVHYELGNYLGGGSAGVVYEATNLKGKKDTARDVAMKILNPVGFKLMPSGPLQRCAVARKGAPLAPGAPMTLENVWWLVHTDKQNVIAAHQDFRTGQLRELPLPRCIEIWGWEPLFGGGSMCDEALAKLAKNGDPVMVDGYRVNIPRVPLKYMKWLSARQGIYREINNMAHLGEHKNVVALQEVLEYVQDSKSTLFLVLELATGGELLDGIKMGCGTNEDVARRYFQQLLDGLSYCHDKGVCHRDLKPENLLLSDSSEAAVLKIADFGLSAAFAIAAHGDESEDNSYFGGHPATPVPPGLPGSPTNLRRLRSVVGSPHYVAPEVTTESVQGYDGPKADLWSAGVILYAMLAGTLPFGQDLSRCPRFAHFRKWTVTHRLFCQTLSGPESEKRTPAMPNIAAQTKGLSGGLVAKENATSYGQSQTSPLSSLDWFFSKSMDQNARGLLVAMLNPEPQHRISVQQASRHCWVLVNGASGAEEDAMISTSLTDTFNQIQIDDCKGEQCGIFSLDDVEKKSESPPSHQQQTHLSYHSPPRSFGNP